MKKIIVVEICLIVAVVFGALVFFLGMNYSKNIKPEGKTSKTEEVSIEKKLVGTYLCDDWEIVGSTYVGGRLELNEDMTV